MLLIKSEGFTTAGVGLSWAQQAGVSLAVGCAKAT